LPIVTWHDDFSVNVNEIDKQHQRMLELVNALHASVEACADKRDLQKMLVALVDFTRLHFSTEEKLMKDHHYPGLASHYKEHRVLLQHMDNLVKAVADGQYPTFYSDYDVSSDWALDHIAGCDKALGSFLNTKGIY
jgi:hemerythrin-like metal-binding protein